MKDDGRGFSPMLSQLATGTPSDWIRRRGRRVRVEAFGAAGGLGGFGAGFDGRPTAAADPPAVAVIALDGAPVFALFFSTTLTGFETLAAPDGFPPPAFGAAKRDFSAFDGAAGTGRLGAAFAGGFVPLATFPAAALPLTGFAVTGFLAADLPALLLVLTEDFPDLEAGRLGRDGGLFGALLRTAVLPDFFPFTLGIRQPFKTPEKMNGAI